MVSVLVVGAGSVAVASSADEGFWYFDDFSVQAVHDEGITGAGVTIAMIDTPVFLDIPTLEGADIRVRPSACVSAEGEQFPSTSDDAEIASHGTQTLSLLVGSGKGFEGQTGVKGMAPGATVLTYATPLGDLANGHEKTVCAGAEDSKGFPMLVNDDVPVAIHDAIDQGADIITASIGVSANADLDYAVARAVREGVIVVASVENPSEGYSVQGEAPAELNGVLGVNFISREGEVPLQDHTDVVAPGSRIRHQGNSEGDWQRQAFSSGTSWAAPIVAGNIALALQKFPEATPNQILQAVIRNTGTKPHPLAFDATFGYGVVVTETLLASDPTEYPDVNPLVTNFMYIAPRVDHIWGMPEDDVVNFQDHVELGIEPPYPIYTPSPEETSSAVASVPASESPAREASPEVPPQAESEPDEGLPGWVIPAIIATVMVIAIIAAIAVILTTRSTRATGGTHGK